jgi:hypothetical protein
MSDNFDYGATSKSLSYIQCSASLIYWYAASLVAKAISAQNSVSGNGGVGCMREMQKQRMSVLSGILLGEDG